MHKELAGAQRFMIHYVTVAVGADVAVEEKSLGIFDKDIAVLEVNPAFSDRLDLGAEERYPRFDGLFDGIVVVGLSVLTNKLHQ
jgi:hypothetical protein